MREVAGGCGNDRGDDQRDRCEHDRADLGVAATPQSVPNGNGEQPEAEAGEGAEENCEHTY